MPDVQRVLLTGATGFVGLNLYPRLVEAGFSVVSTTRDPARAAKSHPGRSFTALDVTDYNSTLAALQGCQAAVYLVHSMADTKDYEEAEHRSAVNFARAAAEAGVSRIVYLGGPRPKDKKPSRHLRSRLRTGEALRAGSVSTLELQATMVIGSGSESWRIVRDLAARLPMMLLPSWLKSRSQPIHIDDVTFALTHALTLDVKGSHVYALPGPETLSARDIILRTAGLLGLQPRALNLPVITPRLSSYWIALVTRADPQIARQLVEGLRTDLVSADEGIWELLPQHTRLSFDEAARRALLAEAEALPLKSKLAEWILHRVTPSTDSKRKPRDATL